LTCDQRDTEEIASVGIIAMLGKIGSSSMYLVKARGSCRLDAACVE
jgi:hypothetical protein